MLLQMWQTKAESMGYAYVASGPLVRSSYKAYVLLFVSNPHTGG